MNRRTAAAALAVISLAAVLMASTSTASAAYDGRFWNSATGRCLTWQWNASHLVAEPCGYGWHGLNQEVFTVRGWRDGTFQLRPTYRSGCLDDSHIGLRIFSPCWSGSSPYSRHQSWWMHQRGGGWVTLQNQATGWCLDDSGQSGLRMHPCNGQPYQNWRQAPA